jgi:hypothetical protein
MSGQGSYEVAVALAQNTQLGASDISFSISIVCSIYF